MANLTSKLFGNQTPDVSGDDSRTQGDENLNALASSMALSMSGLTDTPCTKSGAQLNDTTEAGASETVSGAWTFSGTVVLNGAPTAIQLVGTGDQRIKKDSVGNLTVDAGGAAASLILQAEGGTRVYMNSAEGVVVKEPLTCESSITATTDITSTSGDVSGVDVIASGTLAVDGTITTNVPDGTPAFEFSNAQSGSGLTATAEFIPCRLWDGTIAYLRLWV